MTAMADSRVFLFGVLLGASLWAADTQAASGSFNQSFAIDELELLDVSTDSGSVTIRAGAPGRVEISGKIKVHKRLFGRSEDKAQDLVDRFEANPPVELDNGRLRVGHIPDRAYKRNVSISYEIVVPPGTPVKSHSGSGSQDISGIQAPVEAVTGSGSLVLTDIGAAATARTGSGSIRAEGIAGGFEGHAGSGSIRLTQVAPGDVEVTTGSGSSELRGVVGALRARAGSGRIEVSGRQAGPWVLDTGSGSVRIELPEDAAFEIDAESGSGSITIDHPVTVQGRISRRHIRGEVRGGGELLQVNTGSGGIRVE